MTGSRQPATLDWGIRFRWRLQAKEEAAESGKTAVKRAHGDHVHQRHGQRLVRLAEKRQLAQGIGEGLVKAEILGVTGRRAAAATTDERLDRNQLLPCAMNQADRASHRPFRKDRLHQIIAIGACVVRGLAHRQRQVGDTAIEAGLVQIDLDRKSVV